MNDSDSNVAIGLTTEEIDLVRTSILIGATDLRAHGFFSHDDMLKLTKVYEKLNDAYSKQCKRQSKSHRRAR
jgi:hypothetical protein